MLGWWNMESLQSLQPKKRTEQATYSLTSLSPLQRAAMWCCKLPLEIRQINCETAIPQHSHISLTEAPKKRTASKEAAQRCLCPSRRQRHPDKFSSSCHRTAAKCIRGDSLPRHLFIHDVEQLSNRQPLTPPDKSNHPKAPPKNATVPYCMIGRAARENGSV